MWYLAKSSGIHLEQLKMNNMKIEKINFALLILVVIGLAYIAFYQPYKQEKKMKRCFDVAVGFEKARHQPNEDLSITNQDISGFQKNFISCMAD